MSHSYGVRVAVLVAVLIFVWAAPALLAQPPEARVTLTFTNTDVAEVLSAISAITKQNIAVAGAAKAAITVRLNNATLDESLRTISSLSGLTYRKIGDTYVVAAPADLKKMCFEAGSVETFSPAGIPLDEAKRVVEASFPFLTVSTFPARNLISLTGVEEDVKAGLALLGKVDTPAGEAPATIDTYAPANIKLQTLLAAVQAAYPTVKCEVKGAALVLTGPARDVAKVKELAKSLDVPASKDRVAKVYALQYISAEAATEMLSKALPDLTAVPGPAYFAPKAAQFQPLSGEARSIFTGLTGGTSGYGATAGAGEEEAVKQTRTRTLVLAGTQEAVDAALSLLQQTDIAPIQVMIEAKIVDVSTDAAKDIGIDWSWSNFSSTGQANVDNTNERSSTDGSSTRTADRIVTRTLQIGPTQLIAKLDLMVSTGRAKILANPKIAVLDSEGANIFIGDLLRYTILRQANPITGNIFDVETVPVGIALLVRPRVNPDGNITMKVHPVVSTVTSFVNGIPQTASREADSTIRVRSGETIVIGGLLREDEIKRMKYVPGLSALPIVGELFKHRTTSRRNSEVVIFITPRLMEGAGR